MKTNLKNYFSFLNYNIIILKNVFEIAFKTFSLINCIINVLALKYNFKVFFFFLHKYDYKTLLTSGKDTDKVKIYTDVILYVYIIYT